MEYGKKSSMRIWYPLSAIFLALALLLVPCGFWKMWLHGSFLGAFFLLSVLLLLPLILVNIAFLLYPYLKAFLSRKKGRPFFSTSIVLASIRASFAAKIAVVPLFIVSVFTIGAAALTSQFIGGFSAALFFFPAALLFGAAGPFSMVLMICLLFACSFWTSLYAVNAVIFLMMDQKMTIGKGIGILFLLLLPFTDAIWSGILLPRLAKEKNKMRFSSMCILSLLPFLALVIWFIASLVSAGWGVLLFPMNLLV